MRHYLLYFVSFVKKSRNLKCWIVEHKYRKTLITSKYYQTMNCWTIEVSDCDALHTLSVEKNQLEVIFGKLLFTNPHILYMLLLL